METCGRARAGAGDRRRGKLKLAPSRAFRMCIRMCIVFALRACCRASSGARLLLSVCARAVLTLGYVTLRYVTRYVTLRSAPKRVTPPMPHLLLATSGAVSTALLIVTKFRKR
jgi:hypothetical protein